MANEAAVGALGVVGAGLIGGSIIKRALGANVEVTVYDQDPQVATQVRAAGARVVASVGELATTSDLVVVALAPEAAGGAWHELARQSQHRARPDRLLVLDVASTKAPLLAQLGAVADGGWEAANARFVLTHPMAGREHSGWSAAIADLYDRAAWLVCPHEQVAGADLARILSFVTLMGARPVLFDQDRHDRFAALVSHLPHLIAFCYRELLEAVDPAGTWYRFSGGSLADMLRVADADPALWTQILAANATELAWARDQLVDRMAQGWPASTAPADNVPVTPLFVPGPPAGAEQATIVSAAAYDDPYDITMSTGQLGPSPAATLAATGHDGYEVVGWQMEGTTVRLQMGRARRTPPPGGRHQRMA